MENPILVEALRGREVESRHRGAVAVVDADGSAVLTLGDVACRVFPRSAVKALQALPVVESGIAERYGLTRCRDRPCLRLPFRRAGACRNGTWHPREGRPRRRLPRMRHAMAARRGGAARPCRLGRKAERAAQQLLRQARGLRLSRLRPRRGAGGLCQPGASGAGGRARRPRRPHRCRPFGGGTRHRRLLDPDLCGAAAGPRPRLRQVRHRRAPLEGLRRRGGAHSQRGGEASRRWSPARDGSTRS